MNEPQSNNSDMCVPTHSRAALFRVANAPLQLEPIPIPELHDHEALVQIESCTVCGSDLHTIKGLRQEKTPSILGHEAVGTVVQLSDKPLKDVHGEPLQIGERVTWSTSISCGTCDRCQSNLPQKCRTLSKYGHDKAEGRTALNGGLAEHILLRSGSAVVKLDRAWPLDVMCPVNCSTATVACAYRCAGQVKGQRVLILGAGMLGLTATAMADYLAALSVVVVDPIASRLDKATAFGATGKVLWNDESKPLSQALAECDETGKFDVLLDFSGAPSAVAGADQVADIGARIILVGTVMPTPSVAFHPESIVRRCLTIRGVHNYAHEDLVTAVEFLAQTLGRYPFADLVEKHYSLNDINQAITFALENRPVRIAVHPKE